MPFGKLLCSGAGGSLEYPILGETTKIGRSPEKNNVVLNDSGVSRWHCRISCEEGANTCTVTDLSSANGTHVNGARIDETVLRSGDQVQVGDTILTFQAPPAAKSARVASTKSAKAMPPPAPAQQPSSSSQAPSSQRGMSTPAQKPRSGKPATPGPSACVAKVQEIEERREKRRAAADERRSEKALGAPSGAAAAAAAAVGANFASNSDVAQFASMLQDWHEDNEMPAEDVVVGVPMWTRSQIRVCVRKRPLNRSERSGTISALDVITGRCTRMKQQVVVHHPKERVDLTKYVENQSFDFDQVLDETCDNEVTYQCTAQPLIPFVFSGRKASCFAYGQTGSGKTFTMAGEDDIVGVYQLIARDIFLWQAKKSAEEGLDLTVHVAYFEIYGGQIFDLLAKRERLRVLENGKGQVVVRGLAEVQVTDEDGFLGTIATGNSLRRQGTTSANARSSRSHGIFQVYLRKQGKKSRNRPLFGKLTLIDLAGSERGKDTDHADRRTRVEGAEINKSLLALKECIRAMSNKSSHLPFRASKLTQVLKDSFIGKCRTVMIATVSPSARNVDHTTNTLRYAHRVKGTAAEDRTKPGASEADIMATDMSRLDAAGGPSGGGGGASDEKEKEPEEEEEEEEVGDLIEYDDHEDIDMLQQSMKRDGTAVGGSGGDSAQHSEAVNECVESVKHAAYCCSCCLVVAVFALSLSLSLPPPPSCVCSRVCGMWH